MSSAMRSTVLNTEPLTPGICEWCGRDVDPVNAFCCLSCEAQATRLEAVQGRMVVRALKLWRRHRGAKGSPGEGALTEIASMVDRFNTADRKRREELGHRRRAEEKADAEAARDPDRPVGVGRGHAPLPGRGRNPSRDADSGRDRAGTVGAGGS